MKAADLSRQMREIEGGLRHQRPDWEAQMAAWENQVKDDQPKWTVLQIEGAGRTRISDTFRRLTARCWRRVMRRPRGRIHSAPKTNLKSIAAFRVELLTDPNLPAQGPGAFVQGDMRVVGVRGGRAA